MSIDRILMFIEIGLLIWIVWQGEIVVRCERGVYRIQKEREEERRLWRQAKQKAAIKKIEQKTVVSEPTSISPSTISSAAAENKITDAKSVTENSSTLPTLTTSISE